MNFFLHFFTQTHTLQKIQIKFQKPHTLAGCEPMTPFSDAMPLSLYYFVRDDPIEIYG
jgi:hypothetical protein